MNELFINEIRVQKMNEDEYANLFGIRALEGLGCFPVCPQKFRREATKQTEKEFGVSILKGASCKEIDIEIDRIQNQMDNIRRKIRSKMDSKIWNPSLNKLEDRLKDAKNRRTEAKCIELKQKQEKEEEQKQNIQILEETTKKATTTDPLTEVQQKITEAKEKKIDYTKYIAFGIGGIFLIGAVVLLLKPKSN
jgi:hypothetical protein